MRRAATTISTDPALAGKYVLERQIGRGQMGVVVAARDARGERVAIKYLVEDAFEHPDLVERFTREARALATLRSEHVARVYEHGTLSTGLPFMVLEYLEGADLEWYLSEGGPMATADAVRYVLEICEALAEAHAAKIVHRDLKPANVFLATMPDGRRVAKLLDFGVSKLLDEPMTRTAILVGTALYSSPEHIRSSRGVDARTDIWALGVVLYELLTGTAPFVARNVTDLSREVNEGKFVALSERAPELPVGLSDVIATCLRVEREARYASVLDLAIALEPFAERRDRKSVAAIRRFLAGRPDASPSSLPPTPPGPITRPPAAPSTARAESSPARSAALVISIFLVSFVLAAGAAWFFGVGQR